MIKSCRLDIVLEFTLLDLFSHIFIFLHIMFFWMLLETKRRDRLSGLLERIEHVRVHPQLYKTRPDHMVITLDGNSDDFVHV